MQCDDFCDCKISERAEMGKLKQLHADGVRDLESYQAGRRDLAEEILRLVKQGLPEVAYFYPDLVSRLERAAEGGSK